MNFRYVVKFNSESEGYRIWDSTERRFVGGSFTHSEDAQKVADIKNEAASREAIRHYLNAQPAPIESPAQPLSELHARIAELESMISKAIAKNDTVSPLEAMTTLFALKREFEAVKAAPTEAPATDADDFKDDAYYQDLTDTFMGYDGTNNPVSKDTPATSEDES